MPRVREAHKIRRDALAMATRKLADGCDPCAQGYFDLARKHGAKEGEIRAAREAGTKSSTQLALTRRSFVQGAAVATATLAAQTFMPKDVFALTSAGTAAIAYVAGNGAKQHAGQIRLVGVEESGRLVVNLPYPADGVLRSPGGEYMYGLTVRRSSTACYTVVDIYRASDGSLQRSIAGREIALGIPEDSDTVYGALDEAGWHLAVLHQTRRSSGTTSEAGPETAKAKQGIKTYSQVLIANTVEVFDLRNARSMAYLELGAETTNMAGGQILFGQESNIVVFTFNHKFQDSLHHLRFDGTRLALVGSGTNGEEGRVIPPAGLPGRAATRVLADGSTVVRFWPEDYVQWLSLDGLTLKKELHMGHDLMAKPLPPQGFFSADGQYLYVANSFIGSVKTVDLLSGEVVATTALPQPGVNATGQFRHPGHPGAVISRDGNKLYLVDVRTEPAGIWTFDLPKLTVAGFWSPERPVSAVWLGKDTLFALGTDRNIYGLRSDGTTLAVAVPDLAGAATFIN